MNEFGGRWSLFSMVSAYMHLYLVVIELRRCKNPKRRLTITVELFAFLLTHGASYL